MALIFNEELVEGFTYIPKDERGETKPFSVIIKPIDSVRLLTLEDGLLKRSLDNSISVSTGSHNVSLCKNAITGWTNLTDSKGKAIKMQPNPQGFISEESLRKLPTELLTEIAGVILETSQDPSSIQLVTEDIK